MNKKSIKSTILIVFSIMVFFISLIFIINIFNFDKSEYKEPSYSLNYDDGFYVENYNIKILGKNNRTFEINEEIEVNFTKPRSVLLRDIPVNSGERIRNVKVENGDYLNSYFENNFFTLELGKEYPKITGKKTFKFSYTLITPIMKNFEDSLYLNVIGGGWPKIEKISVELNFPKECLINKEYSQGKRNGINTENYIIEELTDGVIGITNITPYEPLEGLTVRFNYEEGYLKEYVSFNSFIIAVIYALIVVLGSLLLYLLIGTEDEPVEVVNFVPPYDMSPAEIGFLIDNNCSTEDVVSTFFSFASKGYLEIIEKDEKFSFKKIKNIETDNKFFSKAEKKLFREIFVSGDEVEVDTLTYKLAQEVEQVRLTVRKKHSGKLYNNKSKNLSILITFCFAALFIGVNILYGFFISKNYFNWSGIVGVIGYIVAYSFGVILIYNKYKFSKGTTQTFRIMIVLLLAALNIIYVFSLHSQTLYFIDGLILAGASIISSLIIPSIINRTPYYNDLLGNILGFKNFLKTAEKEKLEMLIADNPNYYYDILPYAQVLGVSDVWTEKFKNLTLVPPTYYHSNRIGLFDIYLYNRFFRNANATFRTMSMPKPSSNSSSGFGGGTGFGGGGGFTGGGFGGGGGRSR